MTEIKDLIARSSVGEGLSWAAFGRHLKEKRIHFRVRVSLLSRLTNIAMGRILEIEAGAPPFVTGAEVDKIASALGLDCQDLRKRMP